MCRSSCGEALAYHRCRGGRFPDAAAVAIAAGMSGSDAAHRHYCRGLSRQQSIPQHRPFSGSNRARRWSSENDRLLEECLEPRRPAGRGRVRRQCPELGRRPCRGRAASPSAHIGNSRQPRVDHKLGPPRPLTRRNVPRLVGERWCRQQGGGGQGSAPSSNRSTGQKAGIHSSAWCRGLLLRGTHLITQAGLRAPISCLTARARSAAGFELNKQRRWPPWYCH